MPLAVFRCDASNRIGGGHVVRCMALAQALSDTGWECLFATRAASLETVPAMAHARILVLQGPEADEADEVASAVGRAALAVVDHYDRDRAFEESCRSWADRILAVDDATGRDHACDILVDAAKTQVGVAAGSEAGDARALFGPAYALLKPEFHQLRHASLETRKSDRPVRKIVLSFGMVDAGNRTSQILEQLSNFLPRSCQVEILIGPRAPAVAHVRRIVNESLLDAHMVVDAPDVPQRMAAADVAIGAAGTTSWERCCLGLPALAVVTVPNQRPIAEILRSARAAIVIGDETSLDYRALQEGLADLQGQPQRLLSMSRNAAMLCDGLGAQRISIEIAPERTAEGRSVRLRPAALSDADLIYAWQRDTSTRRYFRNATTPSYQEHVAWLNSKLGDSSCMLSMVMVDNESAGVLRLDCIEDSCYEVSILIASSIKRRGIGTAALRLARRLCPNAELRAHVLDENEASRHLFLGCGYEPTGHAYISRPTKPATRALTG